MKTKDEIRKAIRVQRAQMTLDSIGKHSKAALARLKELDELKQASRIACYLAKPYEVQTQRFVEDLLTEGKQVCVPRHIDRQYGYAWSWVHPAAAWRDGPWRIAEPAHFDPVDLETIDLAIVPAVSLDLQGNRVGHGGGHVDRLLSDLKCTRVGVVFDFQLLTDEIPMEEHDVPVQIIVTDKRTHIVSR